MMNPPSKKQLYEMINSYCAAVVSLMVAERDEIRKYKAETIRIRIADLREQIEAVLPPDEFDRMLRYMEEFRPLADAFAEKYVEVERMAHRISMISKYNPIITGGNLWTLN